MMREFFSWWLQQLVSLLPKRTFQVLLPSRETFTLALSRERLELLDPSNNELLCVATDEITSIAPYHPNAPIAHLAKNLKRVRVRLSPSEFLIRHLKLPSSALPHLKEAIRYQLPRLTPFKPDQVFLACGLSRTTPTDDMNDVWLVVIPKRKLSRAFQYLGLPTPSEAGMELKAPPSAGIPLTLDWHLTPEKARVSQSQRLLWGGAIVMLAMPMVLHLYGVYRTYTEYGARIDTLRPQAEKTQILERKLQSVEELIEYANKLKKENISPLQILDFLTRRLGDDTWLQTLDMKNHKLTIAGISPNPAKLIQLLEDSPLFDKVKFEAAITPAAPQGASRFQLSARLASPTVLKSER